MEVSQRFKEQRRFVLEKGPGSVTLTDRWQKQRAVVVCGGADSVEQVANRFVNQIASGEIPQGIDWRSCTL